MLCCLCSALLCSAVLYSALLCSALLCPTLLYSILPYPIPYPIPYTLLYPTQLQVLCFDVHAIYAYVQVPRKRCIKLRYTGRSSADDCLGGQYQKPITLYPIPCRAPPSCKCCALKYTPDMQMCKCQQHCIKLRYTGRSSADNSLAGQYKKPTTYVCIPM